jgi:YegS/Rv2252/BmrU family lipid kinase
MKHHQSEKIFLIVNQFAGHKKGLKAIAVVLPFLVKSGFQVDYSFTNYAGHATELAKKSALAGYNLVVAVGGDGTVNEVAQGLIGTETALGIIPLGSGNGLARELKISMSIHKSMRTLIDGENRMIDVCRLNDKRFLCTSGIGFDAIIAHKMSKSESRGFLQYVRLVIQESFFFKPLAVQLKIDGQFVKGQVFLITFANASQFGNNAYIAPAASMSDGLIDVVVVHRFSKIWLPVFAVALFTKMITKLPFVSCYKASQIELQMADSPYYHYDGEPGHLSKPAQIKIDPEKIWIRC